MKCGQTLIIQNRKKQQQKMMILRYYVELKTESWSLSLKLDFNKTLCYFYLCSKVSQPIRKKGK